MVIAHNQQAANTSRQFKINMSNITKSTKKLSSGYRINSASDDAACLAISEKMRWQIRGLDKGAQNTHDGISVCSVADGALSEVSDMLNRIKELSVQAANDTNTDSDRNALQKEINQIIDEIDNIGEKTTFNTIPLFKGTDTIVCDKNTGKPITNGSISVKDIELADVDLGKTPFSATSDGDHLALQAIAKGANNKQWNLIFGQGSTSRSSFRLNYNVNGINKKVSVNMRSLTANNYSANPNGTEWTRDFAYTNSDGIDITITQKVAVNTVSDDEKNYEISYAVKNNNAISINMDFMFHTDSAYNNNDRCEGYYTDGNRVDKHCVYSKTNSSFTAGSSNANVIQGVPDNFSIVDVDNALSFSEKIDISGDKPDSVSIGYYNSIDDWSYYDSIQSNTNSNLGKSTKSEDLGFSLMWNKILAASGSQSFSLKYGIISTATDKNLSNVPINIDNKITTTHDSYLNLWIQSGALKESGMKLRIGEMNSNVLGISRINVTSFNDASEAINSVDNALKNVSQNRSNIGAQQNRLEHTFANNSNTSENTSSAESRIRDIDISEEIVNYSKNNILIQTGNSVLAQANQSRELILNLLR